MKTIEQYSVEVLTLLKACYDEHGSEAALGVANQADILTKGKILAFYNKPMNRKGCKQ